MKVKKGDKVVLLNVKNIYGITYECILGKMVGVRQLYGKNVYKIKAKKFYHLVGETDMEGKEMEVSAEVFTLHLLTDELKEQLRELRKLCKETQTALLTVRKKIKNETKDSS